MRSHTNQLVANMASGTVSFGVNVQTASVEVVEIAARQGYDFVMIDGEHGDFGLESIIAMIRAADAFDVTALVRIPFWNDFGSARKVLDAGANGLIIPGVPSAAAAAEVISHCRYFDGQRGARGACPTVRAANHRAESWTEYAHQANSQTYVGLGIESMNAIDALDEICAVEGFNSLFVGQFDLSVSLGAGGHATETAVQDAIARLIATAQTHGVPLHATVAMAAGEQPRTELRHWIDSGAMAVNIATDRRVLAVGLAQILDASREGSKGAGPT